MLLVLLDLALTTTPLALPGAAPIGLDYLAYDAAHARVWVPAGGTGNVDVIDAKTGALSTIAGQPTAPSSRPDRPRTGPSSATVAGDVVWIGNRASKKLCSFDGKTLAPGRCLDVGESPDGLAFVAATNELWVTTPRASSIATFELASGARHTIALPGAPEGYAVGSARFYTNLEDKDRTLVIDAKTRAITATYEPGCGKAGPRGLVVDEGRGLLLVACTDGIVSLDLAHDGKVLARTTTGAGVDDMAYAHHSLYVASGADAMLRVIDVDAHGAFHVTATATTSPGARNAVVDDAGVVYVGDGRAGRVLVVKPR